MLKKHLMLTITIKVMNILSVAYTHEYTSLNTISENLGATS